MKTPPRIARRSVQGAPSGGVAQRKVIRCAIYTRVSTDHGLEQEFNSLDAQREACAAYVRSQMHEGWTTIGDRYDDGGFSGGSLDRPALRQLLADLEARKIDTVVVYKIDRLTRSLTDFAKLVELFEAHAVSFVSVTQSFNTTTSMGRLTLNVLLSFAQFEREVSGEPIRDKVAASKKKGIWVGGVVPLGYRLEHRKLVIDEAEVATVRTIFQRYLAVGGMTPLLTELRTKGVTTRRRTLATSKVIGGIPLGRGALGYLLKNRMYIGELNHRGRSYPGEHPAIVDRDLFAAVQTKLAESRAADHHRQAASEALLIGRIFDDSGNRMTPTHSRKNGARYRYYTSRALSEGRRDEAGSVTRVPAPDVEALVVDAVRHLRSTVDNDPSPLQLPLGSKSPGSSEPSASSNGRAELSASADRAIIAANLDRIVIRPKSIDVHLSERGAIGQAERLISIAWVKPANQRRREVVPPPNGDGANRRAMRADARAILVEAIIKARTWLNEIVSGDVDSVEAIAAREKRSERSIRMTLSLAFLAPDIIAAAVEGTLQRGVGLSRLTDLPGDWLDQRKMLGAFSGS